MNHHDSQCSQSDSFTFWYSAFQHSVVSDISDLLMHSIPNSNQPKFESNFVWLIMARQHIEFLLKVKNVFNSAQHVQHNGIFFYFHANQMKKKKMVCESERNTHFIASHSTPHHHSIESAHANNTCYVQCFIQLFQFRKYRMLRENARYQLVMWFHNQQHLRTNTQLMHTQTVIRMSNHIIWFCSWLVLFAEMILLTKFQLLFYEHHQQMIQPFLFR